MKRTPLARTSRLEPGPPPARRAPLRPVRAEPRQRARESREQGAATRRAPRDTGPSRKVRDLVVARDSGLCVGCGKPVGGGTWWSLQHRVARGVGGGNSPCNLVTLCGLANTGCHGLCEARDREMHARGLWLRSDENPAMVPVTLFSEHGSRVTAWLTDDGTYAFEAPA